MAPVLHGHVLIDNRFEVDTKIGEGTFSTWPSPESPQRG
jgi:hypothetical protein